MVCFESLLNKDTIRIDQLLVPIFGLLSATLTFANHTGSQFKAKHPYVYYDNFKNKVPDSLTTEEEKKWHKEFKQIITANEANISPEMWQ